LPGGGEAPRDRTQKRGFGSGEHRLMTHLINR
jgi:hypothetical protein